MLTTNPRVGIAFLVESLTAFGDMSNVLGSGGSKQAAFAIHALATLLQLRMKDVDGRVLIEILR
jgi:hypothetical protein